ncbi:MAG TPA: hypothetical protein VHB21_00745, partial [Minicystis sp.]|nr:hypothetical protein [Minicystis sp.]
AADTSELARDTRARVERITAAAGGAMGLTRRVRKALRRGTAHATIDDVVEAVRTTLAPTFGDAPLVATCAHGARGVLVKDRADEITLAVLHVALRAFRIAGSGSLHLTARLDTGRDLVVELFARGPIGDGQDGELSADVEVAQLQASAVAMLAALGGTAEVELTGPGELRVALVLPG